MKTASKKTAKKEKVQRNSYTAETKEKARKYYLMGLNKQDISKLLDNIPVRTLEKWQLTDCWTDLKKIKGIKLRALELSEAGKSLEEIAQILKNTKTNI